MSAITKCVIARLLIQHVMHAGKSLSNRLAMEGDCLDTVDFVDPLSA